MICFWVCYCLPPGLRYCCFYENETFNLKSLVHLVRKKLVISLSQKTNKSRIHQVIKLSKERKTFFPLKHELKVLLSKHKTESILIKLRHQ